MTPILDTILATIFVFLVFSLAVSAFNEWLLGVLDRRAAFLKLALREILESGMTPERLANSSVTIDKLLRHGLVASLSRGPYDPQVGGTKGVPSYIPPDLFAGALLSLLKGADKPFDRTLLERLPPGTLLRESLVSIYDEVSGDLANFRSKVETWFDEAMARTSGWYKRYTQKWMLGIAFVFAIACNVDSIRVIRDISGNEELRKQLVANTETFASQNHQANLMGNNTTRGAARTDYQQAKRDYHQSIDRLEQSGIPIGWPDGETLSTWTIGDSLQALAGWALTALAASLGAPFWFDTLNRFINLRSAGPRPGAPSAKPPNSPAQSFHNHRS